MNVLKDQIEDALERAPTVGASAKRPNDVAITRVRADCDRLRGRLFEALESFGLEDRHCQAAKNVVRRLTYEQQANLEATLRGRD